MSNELMATTFPSRRELARAVAALDAASAEYECIDPTPPLARVAVSALVMGRETRAHLVEDAAGVVFSGWVDHRQCTPLLLPEQFARRAAVLEICAGLGVGDE